MINSRLINWRFLLIPCVLTIVGCSNLTLASSDLVTISDIKKQELLEKTINLKGTVENVIPLLNSYTYSLKAENEFIWVVTKEKPPAKGQVITLEGVLKSKSILIDGVDTPEFYLQETKRENQ